MVRAATVEVCYVRAEGELNPDTALSQIGGPKQVMDSHAEVRATHGRNRFRRSVDLDLRGSLAPKQK